MQSKRYFEADEANTSSASSSKAPATTTNPDVETSSAPARLKPSSTLFVSRLPYSATTTDLQTLFSEIGPLKRAFVVTDQATKKSKGVGYVTFAIAEDAKTALQQLQGKSLDGGKRKIEISLADHRESIKSRRSGDRPEADASSPSKRPKLEGTPKDATAHTSRPKAASQDKDVDAVRTVILSGLAACAPLPDSKQIYKRTRKIGDVENVIYPHEASSKPNDVAHVIFRTPNHAMTAVEKLHAHVFKGVQISAILKKRADNAAKIASHMRPETLAKREQMRRDIERNSGKGSMPVLLSDIDKSSRLIVRNLPFDVNEADLRALFLPIGPIYEITIPKANAKSQAAAPAPAQDITVKSDESNNEASGSDDEDDNNEDATEDDEDSDSHAENDSESAESFNDPSQDLAEAVADDTDDQTSDSNLSDADAAAEAVDEDATDVATKKEISAKVGVKEEEDDVKFPAVAQDKSIAALAKATASSAEKGRGFAFVWMVSRNDAARAIEAINGKTIQHGAAEHAAYKAAKGSKGRRMVKAALDKVRAVAQPGRVVAVDWSLSKKDWEAKADQSDAEMDEEDARTGDDKKAQDNTDGENEDEDEPAVKPQLPAPEEGTTLFIRNLPYQATEEELRSLFRQFGPLRYAKIAMDRTTNRSKGTGFVCFWQVSSAEAVLQQARIIEKESGVGGSSAASSSVAGAKNPFAMPSVLTADPAAPLTASLNLHGRVLNVVPAVAREEASKLETSGRKQREAGDKRNTWLLREGVPFPQSEFAARLAPSEVEKRLQSFQVRKAQMGANPSLFVSKTRLSVRSLPLFVSDRMLKRLAIHSIKAFALEVKGGQREDLDDDEKADRTISTSVENRKRKPGERPTAVVQAKVVRQHDRVEALTGMGKSKGFGFLEMKSFQDALKVLRWANGNKEVAKLFGEWWQDDLHYQIDRVATQIQSKAKALETGKGDDANGMRAELEELDLRKKRLRSKLQELQDGNNAGDKTERGGMLMIEFAIENVVTTKKRADKLKAMKDSAQRRKEREEADAEVEKVSVEQQRLEAQAARKIEADKNKSKGYAHGHVIGKKRKERKARRG
ncbi:RNA-binding domain-containing protein [Testicularia cyperi]|uniref:RNA-binding domain-containing protein n=1 Tax=Testicularia cyperi TaxID=1882483 RepID=A0A317XLM4_9BASI|nr:RNA-binding domain-containing protein [Testicularia cyperi]